MENRDTKIGLVIMASGLGKRFGGNKLMESFGGKPLVKWILDASEALFDKRIVVTRSEAVKELCRELDIECIYHELPYRSDTVRLGLSALNEDKDIDYCFFCPGDQPLIKRDSLVKLTDKAKEQKYPIVRSCFGDTMGSPMGFSKVFFEELLNLPEGKGGNYVAKNNPESVYAVSVSNEWELWDVDTREDLEKINDIIK